ncbi:MAG: YgjV family protein [Clostridia bacterium]|nr:YgjV family protein [Clostridia bacterium]
MDNVVYDIITQAVGIIGSIANILSFQCKRPKTLIAFQGFGGLMFALNFFMLGAFTGAVLNGINIIRSLVFAGTKSKNKLIPVLLTAIYGVATVFTYDGILSILVFLAQTAGTIIFYINNDKVIKLVSLAIVSPSWLVYNFATHSIGGIVCECFAITSIIIYIIRTRGFRYVENAQDRP